MPVVIFGAMLVAGTAFAATPRRLPKRRGVPVEDAIAMAMSRMGAANPHSIAQLACSLAYPEGCGDVQTQQVYDMVIAQLGASWADVPPPEGPVQTELVQQLGDWYGTLTDDQKAGLRDILGAPYHDPLVAAILAGDGIALDAEVVRLWDLGMEMYENEKVTALMKYGQLQSLLGPKLNEAVAFFT